MDIYKTIILGVISGVFTSAFIFLCIKIFNQIIIPWYRSIIYSGIDVTGSWTETVEHSVATDISTYDLTQKERMVSGIKTIVKRHKDSEKQEIKVLNVTGHFVDGYLLLTATSKSKKVQSLSTYLLRVCKGGAALVGQANWVDSNNGRISTREITVERKDS